MSPEVDEKINEMRLKYNDIVANVPPILIKPRCYQYLGQYCQRMSAYVVDYKKIGVCCRKTSKFAKVQEIKYIFADPFPYVIPNCYQVRKILKKVYFYCLADKIGPLCPKSTSTADCFIKTIKAVS